MANLQQAPAIKYSGDKMNTKTNWGKAIRTHELETAIMCGLGERDMAMLKIMFFLTGNAEGFQVAEKTICERCNMSESGYKTARKKLVAKGWITLDASKTITVNYDAILNEYRKGDTENTPSKENQNFKGISENTPLRISQNTPLGISENTHNNIREYDKEYDNREALTTPPNVGEVKSSMVAPREEEVEKNQETVKVDGRIARKELVAGAYEYINEEKTLIKTAIGKIFEVYDTNTKVEVIAVGDNKPKATFVM